MFTSSASLNQSFLKSMKQTRHTLDISKFEINQSQLLMAWG